MIINVHAGHNPAGKIACGAIGLLDESAEARKIKDVVVKFLAEQGHTVYDCTCNNGTSVSDVLNKIVSKCNSHDVDLDVSIHLNAGGGHGVEVLVYDVSKNSPVTIAQNVCNEISALGYRNRGIKIRPELTVLCRTKAPAMLVECCFVDSNEDYSIYSAENIAKAIVKGITGKVVEKEKEPEYIYRVQIGAFSSYENAKKMVQVLADKYDLESYVTKVEK